MKKLALAAITTTFLTFSGGAVLADGIVGNWKTKSGETAGISKCGSSFCIKLKTGDHKGKTIGRMKGGDGAYEGTITDPEDNREYSGSAKVSGNSLRLTGCALRVFCRTETWRKI